MPLSSLLLSFLVIRLVFIGLRRVEGKCILEVGYVIDGRRYGRRVKGYSERVRLAGPLHIFAY